MRTLVGLLLSGVGAVASAQPLASDYNSLTSAGLLAGLVTTDGATNPVLGASLGVDRRIRPAAAIRFQVDVALNLSSSEFETCLPAAPCGAKERVEFSLLGLVGPEFGRRLKGPVTPFAGAQLGLHISSVTRPLTGTTFLNEDSKETGVAGGVYIGLRTGQQTKHFRGALSYTRLGALPGAGIFGVRFGVEW